MSARVAAAFLVVACVVFGVFAVTSSANSVAHYPWFQRQILDATNCTNPNEVAVDHNGYIYAACWNNGILRLNPFTGELITVVSGPSCTNPYTIKAHPTNGLLYAGCWTSDVLSINPDTLQVTTLTDQTRCNSVTSVGFNSVNGHLIVSCKFQNANGILLDIDPLTKVLTTLLDSPSCINPLSGVVDPISGTLYAACVSSGVVAVTTAGTITNVLPLSTCDYPRMMAYNSITHTIVVPCSQPTSAVGAAVLAAGTGQIVSTLPNSVCSAGSMVVASQSTGISYVACSTTGGVVAIGTNVAEFHTVIPEASLCSGMTAISSDPNSGFLYASCWNTNGVLQLAPPY